MTITSRFYDTTPGNGIKENEWAVSAVSRGATYGVVGANGLDLTPHPSTPYTLNIGPALEGFWGHGVWDVSDVQVTLPAVTPPATNATRWDLVAARRDWQPTGGGPTALVVVEGTSAQALPATRANTPGEVDDQPLWLVQWRGGDTQPIATIDLRCWAGPGGIAAVDTMALQYLASPGACVHIGETSWRYLPDANGVFSWAIAGSTMSYFAPLSPTSAYQNSGIIQVNGRERNVAISINRVTSGLGLTTTYEGFGNVIPPGARVSTSRQVYVPSVVVGSGIYEDCLVYVNMQSGEVRARIKSGSVGFSGPVSFDVNFTAVE